MLKKNNSPFSPDRLRRATWLPLLALAWLQLTLASHQFDHVAEYYAESCHVCVQLDRVDETTIDQTRLQDVAPMPSAQPAATLRPAVSSAPQSAFHPRAPPRL